ncbi:MAG: hypothetical protein ABIN67_15945, partial [Ferruginibacter sp.]
MNEELHNQQLPLSAEVGWEQMKQLLNQHLPARQQTPFLRLRHYFAAALVAGILLFASLDLDQYSIPHFNAISTSHLPVNKKAAVLTSGTTKKPADNSNNISSATTARDKNNNPAVLIVADKSQLTTDYFNTNLSPIDPINNPQLRILDAEFEKHQIEKANPSIIILPVVMPTAVDQRKSDNKKTNNPWAISIGVGQNLSINNSQQFHPYVVAEISKQLTPRLSVATGIDAYSSVSSNAKGITKTVYVNDLINNIQLYNEITEYTQLNYIDVPFSAGLKISE